MTVAAVRAEMARHYAEVLDGVNVDTYGGPFSLEEIKRIAVKSPIILCTLLGMPAFESQGHVVMADCNWAIFAVTSNKARKQDRDVQAMLLVESVAAEIPLQRWGDLASGRPHDISASNLYSPALDSQGISMWSVVWRQKVELTRATPVVLDDFTTFYGTYDVGLSDSIDTPETEDRTTLPT